MVVHICNACRSAELEKPKDNHPSYLICPSCRAIQLTYQPMPHQEEFHADQSKYRMWAGGYGAAKTRSTVQECLMLGLENPGTTAVMTAQTLPQLRETSMKTFFQDVVPPPLIREHKVQEGKTVLLTGTEYLWRPADDPGKLRSLNLGFWHVEEASEVPYEVFDQLKTRLRSDKMKHHRGILSTNPDLGWVKNEFLLKSAKIQGGMVDYSLHLTEVNPNYATFIADTRQNIYLPAGYYEDQAKGKPDWWINRYLRGSFEHTEGAVYPNFSKTVIEPFEIPKHWNHYRIGHDHGLRNPTAVVFAAINPYMRSQDSQLPKVVVYDLHYEAGQLVPHHAKIIKEKLENVPYGALQVFRIDPSTRNKDPITGKNVLGYYQEHGIYYQPANNSLDYGLAKVNTYIETGALKIFNTLTELIQEGLNYKYPEQELVDDKNADEKPKKYRDHAMDALRYMIVDLPDDPALLATNSYDTPHGRVVKTVTKDGELIVKIQEIEEDDDDDNFSDKYRDWLSYY